MKTLSFCLFVAAVAAGPAPALASPQAVSLIS